MENRSRNHAFLLAAGAALLYGSPWRAEGAVLATEPPSATNLRVLGRAEAPYLARDEEPIADAGLAVLLGQGWAGRRVGGDEGPLVLRGPAVSLAGGASAESFRRLLADLPGHFADAAEAGALELVYDRAGSPSHTLRFRQLLEGARVRRGEIAAHFDPNGMLREVVSTYRAGLHPVNARRLMAGEAESAAREALAASIPGVRIAEEGSCEAWIDRSERGPIHVWEAHHATLSPLGWFVSLIDADSGKVLALENRIASRFVSGRATVFKKNANYPSRVSQVRLADLEGPDENPEGRLRGRRFVIVDDLGAPAASARRSYFYRPFGEGRDQFDQAGAYYHLERGHAGFASRLGVEGIPHFEGPAIPAIVNAVDPGLAPCNAFYAPQLAGYDSPGFAFGNQETCPFANDDIVRDSDVIYHEYTHAVVDWSGIALQNAPLDSYQRAMNEGIADYHAANFTGEPEIGEVFGIGRSVENIKLYPIDVACLFGRMEEHCTGEIWSGFLWDVRKQMKKGGEELAFAALDYLTDFWPSGHRPGEIDFWDGVIALLEADRTLNDGRASSLIYGAAVSRGILGVWPFDNDTMTIVYQDFDGPGTFKSAGTIDVGGWRAPFFFRAPVGRTVSIRVKSKGGLRPSFELLEGTSGYDLFPIASAVAGGPREASLVTTLPYTNGVYIVDVLGADHATTGEFQLTITIE